MDTKANKLLEHSNPSGDQAKEFEQASKDPTSPKQVDWILFLTPTCTFGGNRIPLITLLFMFFSFIYRFFILLVLGCY
jgi:hypothetical protein